MEERAWGRPRLPGIVFAGLVALQISIDELVAFDPEPLSEALYLFLGEGWPNRLAAVGTGRAVDFAPDATGDLEDALIQLIGLKLAAQLQELAEASILFLLRLRQYR
jgi:hypothetical protein